MGTKFNWGNALSSAGRSLEDYFVQKGAQERQDKLLAENRDYQYNNWLRQRQYLDQQATTRDQANFDRTHKTVPFQMGGMAMPENFAVSNDALLKMMTTPEPVTWGGSEVVDIGGKKVRIQTNSLGKEQQVSVGPNPTTTPAGGLDSSQRPALSSASKSFKDRFGDQGTRTYPNKDDDGTVTSLSAFDYQEPGTDPRVNAAALINPSIPGMIAASADSAYQVNPALSVQAAGDAALGVHADRMTTAENSLIDMAVADTSPFYREGDSWMSPRSSKTPFGPVDWMARDKEVADAEVAKWIAENKDEVGVKTEQLIPYLRDVLHIENPEEYLVGGNPIIKRDDAEMTDQEFLESLVKITQGE